jgi:hypothetical protein
MPDTAQPAEAGRTQPVLVVASVFIEAPVEFERLEAELDRVARRISAALDKVVATEPAMRTRHHFSFHYLGSADENAARCERCGEWTTDTARPDPISGLKQGARVSDQLICDECAVYRRD